MTESSTLVTFGLAIFTTILAAVLLTRRLSSGSGVGLTLLYLSLLGVIHAPGAAIHALPWFWQSDNGLVLTGFTQTVYGVVCFGLGALILEPFAARLFQSDKHREASPRTSVSKATIRHTSWPSSPGPLLALAGQAGGSVAMAVPATRSVSLPVFFIILGLLGLLVFTPLTAGIPTGRAIATNLGQLINIGLILACWRAWRAGNRPALWLWVGAACALPLITIVADGFLGFGTIILLSVLLFVISLIRPRLSWVVFGLIAAYIGISFFVTYMRDRETIRLVVWGGQDFGQRAEQLLTTASSFELFDPQSQDHLNSIDDRLNQNVLVGIAANYLDVGFVDFARGDTFVQVAVALVPRVLWPDKPFVAGGSALVTRFTGVKFDENTSVGIGQVLEFYANFGTLGVCVGFLALGWLIAFFDRMAAQRLLSGDQIGFTFWYLPGLGLMLPGNSLAEMTATVGGAFLTAFLVTRVLVPVARALSMGRKER